MSDAEAGALRETYRDLQEVERRPEGVWYAASLDDGAPVTALAIADDLASRVTRVDRFAAAFARASTVRHDAIASPLAWTTTRQRGGTLHCAFARHDASGPSDGALSPSDVGAIGARVCHALTAAHDAGLVHGAISTAALSPSRGGRPRLSRLGLFSALSEGGLGAQVAALSLADPANLSPEVRAGDTPDARSDIFSLGATLYELLTGKLPYGGRTTSFVMASVLSHQEGAVDASNDAIAGPVIEALLRAIEQDPDDRWPSAAAFGQALTLGAGTGRVTAVEVAEEQRRGWVGAILNRWFPARRSR
jgi:hypothetical protein